MSEVTNEVQSNGTEAVGTGVTSAATETKSKKGKRNKPKKPVFAVPKGGFKLATDVVGYDVGVFAKLKPSDFSDPLEYSRWEVWYYQQKAAVAQKEVDTMLSMGSTPEERKEASAELRLLKALAALAAKRKSGGNTSALSRLSEQVGSLFQDLNT